MMQKILLRLVFLCLSINLYAQEGVRGLIDDAIEAQREKNGYHAHAIPGYNISAAETRIVPEHVYTFKGTDGADIKHTIPEHEIHDYQIAQGFDYEKHGKIMQYQQGCIGTVIGDMWFYDKNEGWELIHKDNPKETPKTFEQRFNIHGIDCKDTIIYSIVNNDFPCFIYHRPSKKLLYTAGTKINYPSYHRDNSNGHAKLIVEQEDKRGIFPLIAENGDWASNINPIALDKSGRYCACGIQICCGTKAGYVDYYTSVKIVDLEGNSDVLDNGEVKEFHLTETKNSSEDNPVHFTHLNFLDDGCLDACTVGPENKAHTWRITPQGVKVRHACILDVDDTVVPLGKVYNVLPFLYKILLQSQSSLRCYDKRLLWMIHFFKYNNLSNDGKPESGFFNLDIKKILLSAWWMQDEKLRKKTAFVYGKNKGVLSARDKRAFNILCDSDQKAIENNDPDTLFYTAVCSKKWGASEHSKKLLEYLFSQCGLPELQVINLGDSSIVIDSNGLVTFNHYRRYKSLAKQKNVSAIRQPFFRRYYDLVPSDRWSLQHAQKFIDETIFLSHELEQVDQNIRTLTVRYKDGSGDVVYEEQYNPDENQNLLSEWKRPTDLGSLHDHYGGHYYPQGSLAAMKEKGSFWMGRAKNYLWGSSFMDDFGF